MLKRILPFVAVGGTVAGTICYLLAVLNDYDNVIHHFENGSTKAILAAVFCILSLVAGAVCGLLYRKSDELPADTMPMSVTFAASATMLFTVATHFFSLLSAETIGFSSLISLLFALGTAIFFFFFVFVPDKHSVSVIGFSLCPICYSLITTLVEYRSNTYAVNSEVKIYLLLMWLSFALYFTEEARVALRRTAPWRFAFSAICAMTFGFMQGITEIIGSLKDPALCFSLLDGVQYTTIALLAFCRLLTMKKTAEKPQSENG